MSKHHPVRPDTRLWWAETKQGRVCFELDHHYEMGKKLGSGGYGVVVGAINTRIGSNVAIKKVHADNNSRPGSISCSCARTDADLTYVSPVLNAPVNGA